MNLYTTVIIATIILLLIIIVIIMIMKNKKESYERYNQRLLNNLLTEYFNDEEQKNMLCCRIKWDPTKSPPFIRIYRNNIVHENAIHIAKYQDGTSNIYQLEYNWCQGTLIGNKNWPYNNCGLGRDQYGVYFIKAYTPQISGMTEIISYNLAGINYLSYSSNKDNYYITGSDKDVEWFIINDDNTEIIIDNPFSSNANNTHYYTYLPYYLTTNSCFGWMFPEINLTSYSVPFLQGSSYLPVYRPDAVTSQMIGGEEAKSGLCSTTYLYSIVSHTPITSIMDSPTEVYPYGWIKIKLPNVYDSSIQKNPSNEYDALYYSVTFASSTTQHEPCSQYWSVNAEMMKKYITKDGYVYLFWAPITDISQKIGTTPGIVTTKTGIQGYILPIPTYALIWRFKAPNPNFPGAPNNAKCYPTLISNKGIRTEMIRDGINYCPIVFGTYANTLNEFLNTY